MVGYEPRYPEGLAEGLELLREHRDEIWPCGNAYRVPSGDNDGVVYLVWGAPDGEIVCGCGQKGGTCKHAWAALSAEAFRLEEAEAGERGRS